MKQDTVHALGLSESFKLNDLPFLVVLSYLLLTMWYSCPPSQMPVCG